VVISFTIKFKNNDEADVNIRYLESPLKTRVIDKCEMSWNKHKIASLHIIHTCHSSMQSKLDETCHARKVVLLKK
jgi:hypothetical protein